MKVAIVGSRYWTDYDKFKSIVMNILPIDTVEIISGGQRGVDTMAEDLANELGITFIEYPPEYDKPIPECFHSRDRKIARHCNFMIAFPGPQSKGTYYTMSFARYCGVEPIIFPADK